MSKNRLYVDFHVLQAVPPCCINRDDMNSPKTCEYGGKKRARVSSQSWKHAVREEFKDIFSPDQLGYRTKKMADLVAEKLRTMDESLTEETAKQLAVAELKEAKLIAGDEKKEVLFFISEKQVEALAKAILTVQDEMKDKKDKKKIDKSVSLLNALMESPSVDLCLFGRMSASESSLTFDAASQVAHAISTHAVNNEYDYFTAVDDCSNEAGSAHLGTTEFNASTLYRYANVNVLELTENLSKEESIEAVRGFAEAFIKSMPTGKQNAFGNRTLPDLVYVTVRTDQPINLVGAFEKPVFAGAGGYMDNSKKALSQYAAGVYKDWDCVPDSAWYVGNLGEETATLGKKSTLPELLDALTSTLNSKLS